MYPFHRQHQHRNNTSRSQQGPQGHGKNSRSKNSKESRTGSEPPSPTNDPLSPRQKKHIRTCQELGLDVSNEQDNALRAKEKVLLSSLCSSTNWNSTDNKLRLGPNRYNVFECLQKTPPDNSPQAVEECKKETDVFLSSDKVEISSDNELQKKFELNVEVESTSPKHNLDLVCTEPNVGIIDDLSSFNLTDNTEVKHLDSSKSDNSGTKIQNKTFEQEENDIKIKPMLKLEEKLSKSNEVKVSDLSNSKCLTDEDNKQQEAVSEDVKLPLEDAAEATEDLNVEFMELEDSNLVTEPSFQAVDISAVKKPITIHAVVELKQVVLGSALINFNPQWMGQGFTFNTHHKLRYGFVQKKGGSCGVLATIQAFLLKVLLFEEGACSCTEPLRPTRNEARSALVRALGDVLWSAGLRESATLALYSDLCHLVSSSKYCRDGLTETLNLTSFSSRDLLEEGIKNNLDQFTDTAGNGCLLLVFSAVLSRGLQRVKNDMDECSPLIGQNGQCTLELVNLLLTGHAVSNVFDNNLQVDSCWLRGVNTRADIGFLSLFEYYNSCQVGSYLKTPRYPVWVVCSENHFSVLFSCRRELVSDWRAEKRFHLYYYDGMARQEDEIKLTVDTTGLHIRSRSEGERAPPLEHCIRTKWKDAVVDWNGYQPIL